MNWENPSEVLRHLEETRERQRKVLADYLQGREYAEMEAASADDWSDEDCSDLG